MSPIFRGPPIIKAFDPWVQYDSTRELVERGIRGYLSWHDNTMWYPEGRNRWFLRPGLPFTTAAIYYFLQFLGLDVTVYEVCYYTPAFWGGITIIAIYFMGKEILDHRTGLLAAFFLAFNPGHMQRTMVGFYDNETIGVFASIMVFLFFVKALKTGKPTNALLSGLFLGYLSMSWGAQTFVLLLIPLVSLIMILAGKFSSRLLIAYNGSIGVGLLVTTVSTNFVSYGYLKSDMEYAIPLIVLVFINAYYFFDLQKTEHPKFYDGVWRFVKWAIVPAFVIGAIILWQWPEILPFNLASRFEAILNPLVREEDHVVASVGEHMPSPWSVFYFNTLIPLFLVPVGIYFCFRRMKEEDIFLVVYILTLYYFTGSMIRIVLLFAPAAAIVGAYGLSMVLKHFGQLMKKDKVIKSRRRKRQVKTMMGTQEGIVVFAIVGILMVAQVNHASSVSIDQMSWSELVAGGSFHDWEESLTYMRENLPGTAVVVSWWDYGYWMNVIGNVTCVNDNATFNGTRMGLTGMAMMQTDELESAKIFRILHADYVLVYFGHLLNGLGGDEGKWPWMLRICNDNTNSYLEMGIEAYNWETQTGGDTVFDESKYINQTSGQYEDLWFQSQLVRMMFADEPTELSAAQNNLQYYYAQQLSGDSQNTQPRTDDNGNTWKSHIPTNGQYDFKVFKREFFSTNSLVKIFKVDYTALDSAIAVRNQTLDVDGFGSAVVENTGLKEVSIRNVTVNYDDLSENRQYTLTEAKNNVTRAFEGGTATLRPGESKTVWYWLNSTIDYELDDEVVVDINVEAPALDEDTYEFENSSAEFKVTDTVDSKIRIDRSNSVFYSSEDFQTLEYRLTIENEGETVTKLERVTVNGYEFDFIPEFDDYVLIPGGSREIRFGHNIAPIPYALQEVRVETTDGAWDQTVFTNNSYDCKLTLGTSDRNVLAEYTALDLANQTRNALPVDLASSVVYTNGTAILQVKNSGNQEFGISNVYLRAVNEEQEHDVDFEMLSGNIFLEPGDSATVIADNTGLTFDPNEKVEVYVMGRGTGGGIVSSDGGLISAIDPGISIQLLPFEGSDEEYPTYAVANETVSYMVKNTGNQAFTIDKFTVNGTTAVIDMAEGTFTYGPSTGTLGIQEVAIFRTDVTGKVKINMTSEVTLGVNVTGTGQADTVQSDAYLMSKFGVNQFITTQNQNVTASNDILAFGIRAVSEVDTTVDAIIINGTHLTGEVYLPLTSFTLAGTSTAVPSWTLSSDGTILFVQVNLLTSIGFDVIGDPDPDDISVVIISKEGHQATFTIEAD